MSKQGKAKTLKTAFEPLKKTHIVVFGILIIISTATKILSVINAKLLGEISEKILHKSDVNNVLITLGIILFLSALIDFIQSQIQVRYSANIEYKYKEYTERAIMGSTAEWIKSQSEGDLMTKISTNVTQASAYISGGLLAIVSKIIAIIIPVVTIAIINYKIIVLLIPLMAIAIFSQMLAGKPLQPKRQFFMDCMGESLSIATDGMTNYWQIKINGLEKWILNKFDKSLVNIKRSYLKIFPTMLVFMGISSIISVIPLVFLLFYGAYLCTSNQISLSQYVTIITLGIPITNVMGALSQTVASMQAMKAALSRVEQIWKAPKEYANFKDSNIFSFSSEGDNAIDIGNISFGYVENSKIFEDFSLKFRKNKKYIIVGGNGSGKSTLMNILTGLYIPEQGKITYAFGKEKLDINEFRNKISVVEQDSYLFEDSVINNIFINNSNISLEERNQWYENSFIKEIIDELPQGKDTLVMEGGSNLSGGQKRCVNISRGLVKSCDIVILDEPTANIDAHTAEIVSKEISRVYEVNKSTIIIITHDEKLLNIGSDVQRIELDKLVRDMEENAI